MIWGKEVWKGRPVPLGMGVVGKRSLEQELCIAEYETGGLDLEERRER